MTPQDLRNLLAAVSRGEVPAESASERVLALCRDRPFEDLGYAKVDHHRALRQGFPEVIYGPGKTPEQIAGIAAAINGRGQDLLVTRATEDAFRAVQHQVPQAAYHPVARMIVHRHQPDRPGVGLVVVASAGTSDMPVAEEAAITAECMGSTVDRLFDVGVAGLHRLLQAADRLAAARVLVVVAGMEGALPSVVGGLVGVPVIAVPTSVGYGAHFAGLAPLLAMLNSCAIGVAVVNIDNGFGAGALAHRINALPACAAAAEPAADGWQAETVRER